MIVHLVLEGFLHLFLICHDLLGGGNGGGNGGGGDPAM